MSDRSQNQRTSIFPRYKGTYLCDIIYGIEPMPLELAQTIRTLRETHNLQYPELGFYLCETDQDWGASQGMGKALTELAALLLKEERAEWT